MKKFLYLLYQPYKYLVVIPATFIIMIILGFFAVISAIFMDPKWIGRIYGTTWARIMVLITPVFVKVRVKAKISRKQSFVIVANHQSVYDIFIIYGFIRRDIKWIMKQELSKVPGLNFGSRAIGHIFIDRSSAKAAMKSIEDAKAVLKDGICVVFFPEGSRSSTGQIGKFKKGAFKISLELGLPILPVTIKGTNKILPPNTFDIFPGKVEMIIHEPISTDGYTYENVEVLIEKVREVIISAY
jgi:1-acyl-sn-glycerol-3-phosphate acyltransferase